eukprot:TRINITY_DN8903_c0_g2_i1.p1 TRINITY_DN8903_c0_g2~~TRINITY_DN8903_c0_g2_i1.p1  ORF type:complete len:721 (+),score=137.39 TRINITY_DN8903_c0_g2_i1:33-2195(+)
MASSSSAPVEQGGIKKATDNATDCKKTPLRGLQKLRRVSAAMRTTRKLQPMSGEGGDAKPKADRSVLAATTEPPVVDAVEDDPAAACNRTKARRPSLYAIRSTYSEARSAIRELQRTEPDTSGADKSSAEDVQSDAVPRQGFRRRSWQEARGWQAARAVVSGSAQVIKRRQELTGQLQQVVREVTEQFRLERMLMDMESDLDNFGLSEEVVNGFRNLLADLKLLGAEKTKDVVSLIALASMTPGQNDHFQRLKDILITHLSEMEDMGFTDAGRLQTVVDRFLQQVLSMQVILEQQRSEQKLAEEAKQETSEQSHWVQQSPDTDTSTKSGSEVHLLPSRNGLTTEAVPMTWSSAGMAANDEPNDELELDLLCALPDVPLAIERPEVLSAAPILSNVLPTPQSRAATTASLWASVKTPSHYSDPNEHVEPAEPAVPAEPAQPTEEDDHQVSPCECSRGIDQESQGRQISQQEELEPQEVPVPPVQQKQQDALPAASRDFHQHVHEVTKPREPRKSVALAALTAFPAIRPVFKTQETALEARRMMLGEKDVGEQPVYGMKAWSSHRSKGLGGVHDAYSGTGSSLMEAASKAKKRDLLPVTSRSAPVHRYGMSQLEQAAAEARKEWNQQESTSGPVTSRSAPVQRSGNGELEQAAAEALRLWNSPRSAALGTPSVSYSRRLSQGAPASARAISRHLASHDGTGSAPIHSVKSREQPADQLLLGG